MRFRWLSVGLALMALTGLPHARAQTNLGELRVKLTDPKGLGVRGRVKLSSRGNEVQRTLETGSAGSAVAKQLPFGVYAVRCSVQGFAPFNGSVEMRSEFPVLLPIQLSLATVNASVVVKPAETMVYAHSVGSINRISGEMLRNSETSLPGRSVVDLVNSQPGWIYEGNAVLHPRGSEYQTQIVVDGVPLTDNRSPSFGPEIEANDVQSISFYTANFPAEYGRKMGGVVELSTFKDARPGWHGDIAAMGGSFATADGYAMAQYVKCRNTIAFSADGGRTNWYQNPVVPQNFMNAGTTSDFAAHVERDLSDRARVGIVVRHEQAGFEVPSEQIQEAAGQRQDRHYGETLAIVSYQNILSPNVLADVHAMFRQNTDRFWSNSLSTPVIASQDRNFHEAYLKATVTFRHGAHEFKAGAEADFMPLREAFNATITDLTQFDPATPASFSFRGRGHEYDQAAFVQDTVRWKDWTLTAGLRWDHYQLLVNDSAFSPRIGVARYWKAGNLVVHASYDRAFQTPAFENILLSSSPLVTSLNADFLRLPVRPSRGNYYEAGITKSLLGKFKLDANYYRRYATNFADDDLLLNTSVSFPIAFRKAEIYGAEGKLELPAWGRWSGFLSYSYQVGFAYLPATGGLFLGDEAITENTLGAGRFWNSQDQRNTVRARYRYQLSRRVWVGAGAEYGSGLPVEFEGTPDDAIAQYGPAVVARVDLNRGRVRPQFSLDGSVGADLYRNDRVALRIQADIENITNRLNVIDFAGLFSGNAIGPSRRAFVRLQTEF